MLKRLSANSRSGCVSRKSLANVRSLVVGGRPYEGTAVAVWSLFIVIRLFNLSDRSGKGRVVLHLPAKRAFMARLDERPLKRLRIRDGAVELSLRSREIATLLLER